MTSLNISDYGAVGDGCRINTEEIQRAINECAGHGGGTVLIPPGVFVTGTLWLGDHVHLHLCAGAVLKGSPDPADYNRADAFPQNKGTARHASGGHLLIALNATGVSLTGEGVIDGNEAAFRGPLIPQQDRPARFGPSSWRPAQMVYFCECTDLVLRNVTLRNAPHWHLFLHGSSGARIDSLSIHCDRRSLNGDGIDIDCSRNVVVSNCLIHVSDDAITVRADGRHLVKTDPVCENVVISNSVLSSRCNAIRIGVGDGTIRNISFSNMVISDTAGAGINITGNYRADMSGTEIENLRFDGFSMEAETAFHVTTGFRATKAIRNLLFSNIHATSSSASYLGGCPEGDLLEEITFSNVHMEVRGGRENRNDAASPLAHYETAPTYFRRALGMPYLFYIEHAREIRFEGLSLRWKEIDGLWLHAIAARSCHHLHAEGIRTGTPPPTFEEAVGSLD
ncbi:MAG TPA: glycosyl hydrolase family 28 protein [Chthoniobacteraceae bacterium]|nr:glycosyl hydrolase family 28 protein [Chthoniobacteraceae bacterium]